MLRDARKLCSDPFAAGRLAEQDHAGDSGRDVKEKSEYSATVLDLERYGNVCLEVPIFNALE